MSAKESLVIESILRSGNVIFFAPSSYLGGIYFDLSVSWMRSNYSDIKIIVVDDFLHAQGKVYDGVGLVLSSRGALDYDFSGVPGINFAYSVNTWLFFDCLADNMCCVKFDLPEFLAPLDLPLVYETPRKTRQLTISCKDEFDSLRPRFLDELSLATFDAINHMRLNGDRSVLVDIICPGEQEYFSFYREAGHPLVLRSDEHYVDIGAYNGDTVHKFLSAVRYNFSSVHAFEPDPVNFSALEAGLKGRYPSVFLHNKALSDAGGSLFFSAKGTMGSRFDQGGNIKVDSIRLDDVLEKATLLKMDVEGFEANVLRGAERLISSNRPRMAITCYHHVRDIFNIINVLDDICPGAKLTLRHYSMWYYDTILYVE